MTAVRFEHVYKWYPRYLQVLGGVKAALLHLPETMRSFKRQTFVAVEDLSFEIQEGETVGIVGSNGSGKSTTLALIAGVLSPQRGSVKVYGRVCPLLELGAGFHYDLTGRENIVLNGVLLGLTKKEVGRLMKEIIAFSELEEFLDQPIRTYSTGMVARLGFSVGIHLAPEILLLDEILSVGDLHFQAKCRQKIEEFRRRNVTIVLVSHSQSEMRRLCDRVFWLERGKLIAEGAPAEILAQYEKDQLQSSKPVVVSMEPSCGKGDMLELGRAK